MMEVLGLFRLEDLDAPGITFCCPDLTTFCRLGEVALEAVGQHLGPGRAVLACRVVDRGQWCRRCERQGCLGIRSPDGWRTSQWGGVR